MGNKLYLIDGSSFLYRAYYALPYLATSKGFPTRVVLGFLKMLNKILKEHNPSHIAVIFDPKGPTFRHEMMESYKIKRPPMPDEIQLQIPYVRGILDAMRLKMIVKDGFEADDVIASLVAMHKDEAEIVVVTADKDLFQLTASGAVIWHPQKDIFIDREKVREILGIEPEQIPDYLGLSGDAVDGVPGVKGIGGKTAEKLIREYGSIDAVLNNIEKIQGKLRKLLEEGKESALLSRDLCKLRNDRLDDGSLDGFVVKEPDSTLLAGILKELEFYDLIKEFGFSHEIDLSAPEITFLGDKALPVKNKGYFNVILSEGEVCDLLFTTDGKKIYKLEGKQCKDFFQNNRDKELYTFDGKSVLRFLITNKIEPFVFYDLSVISYLLNPSAGHFHTQQDVFRDIYGVDSRNIEKSKKSLFAGIEEEKTQAVYLKFMPETAEKLMEKFDKNRNIVDIYHKIEHPLTYILARMEISGIRLDVNQLQSMSVELDKKIKELETEIYNLCGKTFNIGSPKQLSSVLYEDMKLTPVKKGKTAFSTASDVLDELYASHPVIPLILDYRNISKLKNTYIDVLPGCVKADRRIHTTFNQTLTATGRLSSSNPNLQNIPVKYEWGERIRRAFVADEGYLLISADYSQIEIRILAEMSKDEILISDFKNNRDIHTATASKIFDVPLENVTKDMRRQAKTINFGILYGMGAYSLSKELKVIPKEADEFIKRYFEHYKQVKSFRDNLVEEARKNKYVSSLWGRKRYIYEIDSADYNVRQNAERIALNSPLQSTAADIVKRAMIDVSSALKERKIVFKLLLQIHDELVLEVEDCRIGEAVGIIKSKMESVVKFSVPLEVKVGIGKNWHEAAM